MTGWGVERMPRAAVPVPVPPTGVRTLMPPHSQGAERRAERRPGRTAMRWGLRALVIGGLAGTAWLLTGAAAHAADRTPAPEGSALSTGLVGSVVSTGGHAPTTVIRVLQAAAQPLESDRTRHHRGTASVLDAPARVLSRPAGLLANTLSEATPAHKSGAGTALGGVDRVVRDLTGPLRLTGGPGRSPLEPVTAPLTRTLRPVTGLLPHAVRPAGTAYRDVAETPRPVVSRMTGPGHAPSVPIAGPTAAERILAAPAGPALSAWHRVLSDGYAPDRVVTRPSAVGNAIAAPETARENPPGGDGPAPLQVHFGAISGLSTSGSGAPTEGGSAAILPAAVAAGSMASHRLPIATGVEVRRYDAEAPTVSPD